MPGIAVQVHMINEKNRKIVLKKTKMPYFNKKKIFTFLLYFIINAVSASEVPPPLLTKPLASRDGASTITNEMLLSLSSLQTGLTTVNWINNHTLIYSLPIKKDEPEVLELYDLYDQTHRQLTEGSIPKPSHYLGVCAAPTASLGM